MSEELTSVQKMVRDVVTSFGYKCYVNEFPEADSMYFTFFLNVVPTFFADDEVLYVTNLIQLHLICPLKTNTVSLRKELKLALQSAGFTYPDETNTSDEREQHIVFEFENEEYV